jgi:hypothetical protein
VVVCCGLVGLGFCWGGFEGVLFVVVVVDGLVGVGLCGGGCFVVWLGGLVFGLCVGGLD